MPKKLSDKQKLRNFFSVAAAPLSGCQPACRHFGDCGGCEFQNIPYPDQLSLKRRAFAFILDSVLEDYRWQAGAAEDPAIAAALGLRADRLAAALAPLDPDIVASPVPYGYRQRMDYVFACDRAGLRRANRHRQVVELAECPLIAPEAFAAFRRAHELAVAANFPSYDYMRHHGDLRYFVVRRSRNGQVLLSLVTKSREHETEVMAILNQLLGENRIASGHWLLAEGLGDVSFGQPLAWVGQPWIEENLNGVSLRIGPNTFFQANPAVAELAYAALRDFVPPGGEVLDLYSGVGGIALSLAPAAGRVTAVENVPDNVSLAAANIAANQAANLRFVEADSAVFLRQLADDPSAGQVDMAVVNPPRAGVEGSGMADLARLRPARLAYLSCNPFSLLRNLSEILDRYALKSLTLYDMFPQTRHFESLARLERLESIV